MTEFVNSIEQGQGHPMGINLKKSSSTSVGARVVEWGRVGL